MQDLQYTRPLTVLVSAVGSNGGRIIGLIGRRRIKGCFSTGDGDGAITDGLAIDGGEAGGGGGGFFACGDGDGAVTGGGVGSFAGDGDGCFAGDGVGCFAGDGDGARGRGG